MRYLVILSLLLLQSIWAKPLRFAPLPMFKSELIMEEYRGILEHLEKELGITIETVYYSDYKTLLEAIRTSKVDIAHLGPLPYATLLKETDQVQPIVQFLNKDGQSTYTCSLFSTREKVSSIDFIATKPIALTQPLSTCGYLSAAYLYNGANLELKEDNYYYANTHSNVILEVLLGQAQSGIAKTSEFLSYSHLGIYELARTPKWPGFLWVGSPTLSPTLISQIQNTLTPLYYDDPLHRELMSSWGDGVKYGAVYTNAQAYKPITQLLEKFQINELP